jgi:Peptidase family M28
MRTAETVSELAAFEQRGAGSDAERRAARWLQGELASGGCREARIEPFWCRPNWALAHSWHAALGVAGSLIAVSSARIGGAMILVALLSTIADGLLGTSIGRRLTPERASQNVVAEPPRSDQPRPVKLIITANYDAGRTGAPYWNRPRRAVARVRSATRGVTPGWLGWLVVALIVLEAVAIARLGGTRGTAISVVQLIPTVGLVLGLALLLDVASAAFGPAANDNGTGVAAAIAIARALDAAAPRNAAVEIVLAGAGDGSGIGIRSYLKARRKTLTAQNAVVLGIAACGVGTPRWWTSDGHFVPLTYFAKLRELSAGIAGDESGLRAAPHRGRGSSPAFPARLARLPAITIGCLDDWGVAPRSHQRADTTDAVDPAAIERTVEFTLLLVDAVDAYLAEARAAPTAATT